MAATPELIEDLEVKLAVANAKWKQLLREDTKLKAKRGRKAGRKPTPSSNAEGLHELDQQLKIEEIEATRLQRVRTTDSMVQQRLMLQKQALELTYTQWNTVVAAVGRVYDKAKDQVGFLDCARVVDSLRDDSNAACLVSLPRLERLNRTRRLSKSQFLARIRPKAKGKGGKGKSLTAEDQRLLAVLDDLERSQKRVLNDCEIITRRLNESKAKLKHEAAELRHSYVESTNDTKTLKARLQEEIRKGDQLTETLGKLEAEAVTVGPAPTPSKHLALLRSYESMEEEKKKLEISLAAMLAVKVELIARVTAKESTAKEAEGAVDMLQQRHSKTIEAAKQHQPEYTSSFAIENDGRQQDKVLVEGGAGGSSLVARKLGNAVKLVDARVGVAMKNLKIAEEKIQAGLDETQKALREAVTAVKARRLLMTRPTGQGKETEETKRGHGMNGGVLTDS